MILVFIKVCPFCDDKLQEYSTVCEFCCYEHNVINDNGKLVCKNCGKVDGYGIMNEYIDFYENKHKIIRKSVYHRKYHIKNVINNINIDGGKVSLQNSLKLF